MLEKETKIIDGKEFTVTESVLRHYDGSLVKGKYRKIVEVDTDRVYDGIVFDLKGYEREYAELEEEVVPESNITEETSI